MLTGGWAVPFHSIIHVNGNIGSSMAVLRSSVHSSGIVGMYSVWSHTHTCDIYTDEKAVGHTAKPMHTKQAAKGECYAYNAFYCAQSAGASVYTIYMH